MFKRKDPSKLQEQFKSFESKKSFEADDAIWNIKGDKSGNASAVIRFLPAASDDANTIVKLVTHGFQRNGKWYIENCTSTHGDYASCPACEWISAQKWDYNNEEDKKAMYASKTTRQTNFWANVLIIKDPANPENEGKVFKYRFGKKIFDKIQAEVLVDESMGETPCDVTCPFEGKNFLLKLKKVGGNNNYDDSKFQNVSAIDNIEDEEFQKQLQAQMHDISALAAPAAFKSKEDLQKQFNRVMGGESVSKKAGFDAEMDEFSKLADAEDKRADDELSESQSKPKATATSTKDDVDLDDLINSL